MDAELARAAEAGPPRDPGSTPLRAPTADDPALDGGPPLDLAPPPPGTTATKRTVVDAEAADGVSVAQAPGEARGRTELGGPPLELAMGSPAGFMASGAGPAAFAPRILQGPGAYPPSAGPPPPAGAPYAFPGAGFPLDPRHRGEAPAPVAARRGARGCAVAAAVGGGLAMLALLGVGIGSWLRHRAGPDLDPAPVATETAPTTPGVIHAVAEPSATGDLTAATAGPTASREAAPPPSAAGPPVTATAAPPPPAATTAADAGPPATPPPTATAAPPATRTTPSATVGPPAASTAPPRPATTAPRRPRPRGLDR